MDNSPKILLITNEDDFSEIAAKFFKSSALELFRVRSLEGALTTAQHERPGLILLDADVRDLDPVCCIAALKADGTVGGIPVVTMVSPGRHGDAETLQQAGCDEVMVKPLDGTALFATVSRFIPSVKQRGTRVPCYTQVTIHDEDDVYYGMTGDISTGGVFVATFDRLPEKGEIRLSFTLPEAGSAPIVADGRVVWLNSKREPVSGDIPEGFGLEFTSISYEQLSAIKAFIEAAMNKARPPRPDSIKE